MNTKLKKPKNLAKKICLIIYLQDKPLSFNELFSCKYEDDFLLHTGLYVGEALKLMSEADKVFVREYIEDHNFILS